MNKQLQELVSVMSVAIRNVSGHLGGVLCKLEYDITLSQLGILEFIWESSDSVQSAVASEMCMDKSAILRQVDVLENMGLLERRMDPSDRRRKHLVLSRSGQALLSKWVKLRTRELSKLAKDVSVSEIETCSNVLAALSRQAEHIDAK